MSHEIPLKIKDLLKSEENWTKYALAKNKNGIKVSPNDPKAVCFCLTGAIQKIYPDKVEVVFEFISREIIKQEAGIQYFLSNRHVITDWNDSVLRTFTEVKSLIQKLDI